MRFIMGIFLCFLCMIIVLFGSCRRQQPSLVDANQPPDTELWYAPAESSEYEYSVHLFWRGVDNDGDVVRYIYVQTDTIIEGELAWNPSDRLRDRRAGRTTIRTDSVFSFSAYQSTGGGYGIKKNRQAFHVAAIDNNGVIDPTPARIEFVATIDQLPKIHFRLWRLEILPSCDTPSRILRKWREIKYDSKTRLPTVGMLRPFKIVYEGFTTNGEVLEYQWYPLVQGFEMEGQEEWTTDLGDTIRDFPNAGDVTLPSGVFRFAAQCKDASDAESIVDPGNFREGVLQLKVNFDPETEIFDVRNIYIVDRVTYEEPVEFRDGKPDTIPFQSWITLFYRGSNDMTVDLDCEEEPVTIPRDSSVCEDDTNKCLTYQVRYCRDSKRFPYAQGCQSWLPHDGEDTNPFGTADSTSLNIGTLEYSLFVRSVDEYGLADGTPDGIDLIVGNIDPVLDSIYVTDWLGNKVYDGDTLTWNWWQFKDSTGQWPPEVPAEDAWSSKRFSFIVNAFGHDSPKEDDSGVKSWIYKFLDLDGEEKRFANSGSWLSPPEVNVFSDEITATFTWNPWYPAMDLFGDSVFTNLPPWINKTYDLYVKGRDTATTESDFNQYMFLHGEKELINSYPISLLGRWTKEKVMRFHLRIVRP